MRLVEKAALIVRTIVTPGSCAVDATVGNGFDLLTLAEAVGESGHVYGFDIQADALRAAEQRLRTQGMEPRVTLFCASHARMLEFVPPAQHGKVQAVMFNLGYLPGGDHAVTTQARTTVKAIKGALSILHRDGVISLVYYTGHPGGTAERDSVLEQVKAEADAQFIHLPVQRTGSPAPGMLIIGRSQATLSGVEDLLKQPNL